MKSRKSISYVIILVAVILLTGLSFSVLAQQNTAQQTAQMRSARAAQQHAIHKIRPNDPDAATASIFSTTNFIINICVSLGLIILFIISHLISKTSLTTRYDFLRPQRIFFYWNTLMMLAALTTIVTGFMLSGLRTYPVLHDYGIRLKPLLFWHVIGGNVFAVVVIMHVTRRFKIYLRQLKIYRKPE